MRPENKRMQAFLAANGIAATPKYIVDGTLRDTWRLYNHDLSWTPEITAKLTALGFTDFEKKPLGRYSGNGGQFSVFVHGHDELLRETFLVSARKLSDQEACLLNYDISQTDIFPILRLSVPHAFVDAQISAEKIFICNTQTDQLFRKQGRQSALYQELAKHGKEIVAGCFSDEGELYLKPLIQRLNFGQSKRGIKT